MKIRLETVCPHGIAAKFLQLRTSISLKFFSVPPLNRWQASIFAFVFRPCAYRMRCQSHKECSCT